MKAMPGDPDVVGRVRGDLPGDEGAVAAGVRAPVAADVARSRRAPGPRTPGWRGVDPGVDHGDLDRREAGACAGQCVHGVVRRAGTTAARRRARVFANARDRATRSRSTTYARRVSAARRPPWTSERCGRGRGRSRFVDASRPQRARSAPGCASDRPVGAERAYRTDSTCEEDEGEGTSCVTSCTGHGTCGEARRRGRVGEQSTLAGDRRPVPTRR